MDLKKRKIAIFAKGIVHDFGQKVEVFHLLCFSKMDREKVFAVVLDKKETFKDYKKKLCTKNKIRIFPNGLVHRFDQKFEISSPLIVMQNRLRRSIWERSS